MNSACSFRQINQVDESIQKRTKERSVEQAYNSVLLWRQYFKNGIILKDGSKQRLNLQEAAIKVGIPKKTLEDYSAIFKKLQKLEIDINTFKNDKMGLLRQIIKNIKDHQQSILRNQNPPHLNQVYKEHLSVWRDDINPLPDQDDMILEDNTFCSPGLYDYISIPEDVQNKIQTFIMPQSTNSSLRMIYPSKRELRQYLRHDEEKIIFEE